MQQSLSRRGFVLAAGAVLSLSVLEQKARAAANGGYFSLGVASGSPQPDQVIL